jgi:hypothetical protein
MDGWIDFNLKGYIYKKRKRKRKKSTPTTAPIWHGFLFVSKNSQQQLGTIKALP